MPNLMKCLMLTGLLAGCDAAANSVEPGGLAAPGPSLAALVSEHYSVTEPFSMVFDNPCNGTTVQVMGQIVHTFQGVTDVPGSDLFMHWKDNFRVSGTGLGSDGTRYVFNDTDMEIFQSPTQTAPQVTFTSHDAPRLVSKGSSPNFMIHLQFHVTVTPDGTLKVLAELDHTECRG